jgi:hypothetical protein
LALSPAGLEPVLAGGRDGAAAPFFAAGLAGVDAAGAVAAGALGARRVLMGESIP